MPFTAHASRLLVRELQAFQREVALFPDDESLWRVLPGVTNPAGNLALHVAGNLRHFVGAMLGGSGYVRDRAAEFSPRAGSRQQVDRELETTIDDVVSTLDRFDPARLDQPFPGAPNGMVVQTDLFLLHLVAHTAFHLGQAGYIRRLVTGDPTSADPVPTRLLVDKTEQA